LKQMGLAIHNFEGTYNYVPAWGKQIKPADYPTSPANAYGQYDTFGPLFHLLPFMDQASVYNLFDSKRAYVDKPNMPPPYGTLSPVAFSPIKGFICPSLAGTPPSDYGPYFASAGLGSGSFIAPRTDYVPIRGLHKSLNVCAGGVNADTDDGMLGTDSTLLRPTVRFADVTDGLSNTILFAELAGKQNVYYKSKDITSAVGLQLNAYFGDQQIARKIRGYSGANPANPAEAGCSSINILNVDGLYSFHVGGIHAARGDGSVTFLSENMSSKVLAGLITRNGGEVVSAD
jgi:hypothetical protein